ncbi:conserved hypothetical protein [Candida tropicalis MYA-3404]|uniref:Uncharacterized protein n=1 Tax=Candida tropicalis (strain ATCC MYA-3404 / T1) TaxID=294747 RepID=C5MES5_CANTT|nr:conserved hypothetical protein [Candida tropicalis MYA-3404]EER31785.1 conserved hypothetical protein [Candida tropicalis MYA-3404]KAG4405366.1 hypothetical protein JTP64_005402 [Candida tropicalis]
MSALDLPVPEVPKTPELVPVFTINLKLANDPAPIYSSEKTDLTLNLATIINGDVKTVPNKFGLELDIDSLYGTDNLNVKNSANTAYLDCQLFGKTPNGSGVRIYYPGRVQLTQPSTDVFAKKSQGATVEESYVTCNPTFFFDDKVEDKFRWVEKENLFGKGRFARSPSDGALYVQYYVYVVR